MQVSFKQVVAGVALALGATAANAATVTFNFDYLANNGAVNANNQGAANLPGLPIGDFATASGGTAVSVGSITFTDLSDLNLGDGYTGVRTTISLNGLDQFSSGAGSVFISSFEINFAGTENLTNASYRTVAGLNTSNIEFAENGTLNSSGQGNNWGNNPSSDPAWGQEINFTAGTFINGQFSTLDFLNGEALDAEGNVYNGFSVAALLDNAVISQNTSLPDAYAWIRIRSTGGGIANEDGNWWGMPIFNAAGGRLDVLAVAAVPEPSEYALMLVGLGLIGAVARRRKSKDLA